MKRSITLVLLLQAVVMCTCAGGKAPGHLYLSIGDSIAAGNGSSDPASTSFAALVAEDQGVQLHNLAKAGATTGDVIEKQLPDAVALLNESDVRFVTISAGGNDLAALIPNASCVQEPLPPSCPLVATLTEVEGRLRMIVDEIREADSGVPIILLAYPNFFSGTGHAFEAPAARVLPRFGEMVKRIAADYADIAVATPSFEGRGGEVTHVNDAMFDPHPNDAGHLLIADAVLAAINTID